VGGGCGAVKSGSRWAGLQVRLRRASDPLYRQRLRRDLRWERDGRRAMEDYESLRHTKWQCKYHDTGMPAVPRALIGLLAPAHSTRMTGAGFQTPSSASCFGQ
jgi:hypothetical protein